MTKPKSTMKTASPRKRSAQGVVNVLAFTQHDHKRCIRSAMGAVVQLCELRKVKLTPVRQQTLEILLESHTALGAYEVLGKLSAAGFGKKPPMVYRALGFLMEQGFVHKLEKLNAYVACVEPGVCSHPCLMVCKSCGRVAEQSVPGANKHLTAAANQLGFSTATSVMELSGICSQCPVESDAR